MREPQWATVLGLVAMTGAACSDRGNVDPRPAITTCRPSDGGVDSGVVDGVQYDERCDKDCLGSLRCLPDQIPSGCACVPVPDEARQTNPVGCDELMSAGGVARTPEESGGVRI